MLRKCCCGNLRSLGASQKEGVSVLQYRLCLRCRQTGPGLPSETRGSLAGLENQSWRPTEELQLGQLGAINCTDLAFARSLRPVPQDREHVGCLNPEEERESKWQPRDLRCRRKPLFASWPHTPISTPIRCLPSTSPSPLPVQGVRVPWTVSHRLLGHCRTAEVGLPVVVDL